MKYFKKQLPATDALNIHLHRRSKILVRFKWMLVGKGFFGTNKHLNYSCQNSYLHCCDLDKHKDATLYESLDLQRLRGMIWYEEQAFFIIFHKQQYKKVAYQNVFMLYETGDKP